MAKKTRHPHVLNLPARPFTVRPALPAGGRITTGGLVTTFAGNPERFERGDGDRQNPNFDAAGHRKDEDERKPRYEVELFVRTYFGDVGVRPTNDPNLVFWESPDIWIDGPSGDPDQATPGVANTVNVHVWNVGLADCWSAHVDLYWCDPSVGVASALAHAIGSTVVTLMGGEHKIVPFTWVPSLANGGHECLVAQVYSPVSDPLMFPFNPTQDRHVCQRNISVVTTTPGKAFEFLVSVPNLSLLSASSVLEVELLGGQTRQRFFKTIGAPEAPAISRAAAVGLAPRFERLAPSSPDARALSSGAFREVLDPEPSRVARRLLGGSLRALAAPRPRLQRPLGGLAPTALLGGARIEPQRPGRDSESTRAVTLRPGAVLQMAVQGRLPPGAGTAGRDVYRVTERVGGRVTGGVTFIVKAPAPAKVLRTKAGATTVRRASPKAPTVPRTAAKARRRR